MSVHADPVVTGLREEIAALDAQLVATINARIKAVERLHRHKRLHDMPVLDPNREAWLAEHLRSVNKGPLSDHGVHELLAFVLGLVKREVARA